MKQVAKGAPPAEFDTWKALANEGWQPSYGALQNPEKQILHEALLAEQAWVCCYCGRGISLADSHIEHFRPQESHSDLALDFNNLHASCIRETKPGAPLHCGHAKGHDYEDVSAISPLDPGCEQRFTYSPLNGAIYPADASAIYMAGLLRLDISFLRDRRAEALRRVFDDEFVGSASAADFAKLAQAYRQPNSSGRVIDFAHVLARYAEKFLEDLSGSH